MNSVDGKMGIEGRGIIKEGYWADPAIFNPAKIKDKATSTIPTSLRKA